MVHELEGNILIKETVAAGSYTEGSSDPVPTEVDVKDTQNTILFVDVGTLGSDTLTVELHGADESGGSFSQVNDKDGNPAQIEATEAGEFIVEAKQIPRYLKAVVTQGGTATDDFGAFLIAGNAETYPIE